MAGGVCPLSPIFVAGSYGFGVRADFTQIFCADFTQIFLQDVLGDNYLTESFNHWLKNANPIAKPNLRKICAKPLRNPHEVNHT